MSFMGITTLGYQDPFKATKNKKVTPSIKPPGDAPKGVVLPPINNNGTVLNKFCNLTHPENGNQKSVANHELFTHYKHVRSRYNPSDLTKYPLTSSQEVGWQVSTDKELKSTDSWTFVKRYPQKNCEMSMFVKEMKKNDRLFTYF